MLSNLPPGVTQSMIDSQFYEDWEVERACELADVDPEKFDSLPEEKQKKILADYDRRLMFV